MTKATAARSFFPLSEDVPVLCLTCPGHMIGLIKCCVTNSKAGEVRQDFQAERGTQGDEWRCMRDASKTEKKSDIQTGGEVESNVAECRLIETG